MQSFIQVKFHARDNTNDYLTADQQVLNLAAGIAWCNNFTFSINGYVIDQCNNAPEVVLRIKMQYLDESFIRKYGTLYGLFMSREEQNSAAPEELSDITDTLCASANANHVNGFILPFFLLSDFCNIFTNVGLEHQ
jgi:hypothetical protein